MRPPLDVQADHQGPARLQDPEGFQQGERRIAQVVDHGAHVHGVERAFRQRQVLGMGGHEVARLSQAAIGGQQLCLQGQGIEDVDVGIAGQVLLAGLEKLAQPALVPADVENPADDGNLGVDLADPFDLASIVLPGILFDQATRPGLILQLAGAPYLHVAGIPGNDPPQVRNPPDQRVAAPVSGGEAALAIDQRPLADRVDQQGAHPGIEFRVPARHARQNRNHAGNHRAPRRFSHSERRTKMVFT